MYEIASLKSKKLPEIQEIAKALGVKRITGLKKMELIYQIIDTVAAAPGNNNDDKPSEKEKPNPSPKADKKERSEKIHSTGVTEHMQYKNIIRCTTV